MSKKRFTEGLESIFGDLDDTLQEQKTARSKTEPGSSQGESSKRSSGKNFASDLQAFLEDAFEESLEEQLEQRKQKRPALSSSAQLKKRHKKPLSGLDALIRSTVEPSRIQLDSNSAKRITLTLDQEKVDRLKSIARKERTYLRDIIDQIVAEFLEEYDSKREGK